MVSLIAVVPILNCHSIRIGVDAQIGLGAHLYRPGPLNAAGDETDLRLQATTSDRVDRVRSPGREHRTTHRHPAGTIVVRNLLANGLASAVPARVMPEGSLTESRPLIPTKIRGHEGCKAARPRNLVVSVCVPKHVTARSTAYSTI